MIEKNSFANINAKDIDGRTALMHAIKKTSNNTKTKEKNRTDVVRLLINKGANVNAKDANKWTPLIKGFPIRRTIQFCIKPQTYQ